MGNVVGRLLKQDADVGVVELVENASPASLTNDKAQVTKDAQLVRDGRLLHPNCFGEFAHGAGTFAEPGEDEDATWRRERLHRLRDFTRGLSVDNSAFGLPVNAMAHESHDT